MTAAQRWALDATAEQIRSAMLDPASFASGGWRIPGTAGARIQANARASVAMQQRIDGGWEFAPHNLLFQSEAFDNAAWAYTITTAVTANAAAAPDGTQSADTAAINATTQIVRQARFGGVINGATYTLSVWAKASASGGAANVRLTVNNTVSWTGAASQKVALTSQWQRITLPWTANAVDAYFIVGAQDATGAADSTCYGNVDLWGAQLNLGPAPTAYVPTTTAAVYAPAIDWLSGVGRYGVRSEQARTNAIRNSAMVGAGSGTPGTLPINGWGTFGSLTQTITAGVTLFGFPAFDIRFQGTFTGQQGLQFDIQRAAATSGQTWTGSVFVALVAGAMTNVSSSLVTSEHDSGGAFLDGNSTSFTATGAGARVVGSRTLNNASTASTQAYFAFNCTGVVDFTVRVACPQLEQGAGASSPILTYGAAATRATDTVDVTLPLGLSGLSVYSMIVDYFRGAPVPAGAFLGIARITAAGNTNLLIGGYVPPAQTHRANFLLRNGGAIFDTAAGGSDVSTASRLAMRFQSTLFAASFNGAAVSTSASVSFPAGLDTLRLGMLDGNLNGHITRTRLAGTPINDSLLQALTA